MSQAELAGGQRRDAVEISVIEGGRTTLGAERAERIAQALRVHPAVLRGRTGPRIILRRVSLCRRPQD